MKKTKKVDLAAREASMMRKAPDGLMEILYIVGEDGEDEPEDLSPLRPLPPGLPPISYKPGWTFWWEMRDHLYWCCRIREPELKAVDCHTGEPRPIAWKWRAPYPFNLAWHWDIISGIEYHMRGEWLKVSGKTVMNPHRETPYYQRNRNSKNWQSESLSPF